MASRPLPRGRGGSPACRLYSERAVRAPSPLGEKVPEGRMRGPSLAPRKVAPHQLGQMTYARATSVGVSVRLGARGRKSWPRILSPEGRGGSPACRLYSERAVRAPSPPGAPAPEGRMRGPSLASRKVAPHQLGQMTYVRAASVGVSVRLGARGRKSWPRVLSPEGRGGSPACRPDAHQCVGHVARYFLRPKRVVQR